MHMYKVILSSSQMDYSVLIARKGREENMKKKLKRGSNTAIHQMHIICFNGMREKKEIYRKKLKRLRGMSKRKK